MKRPFKQRPPSAFSQTHSEIMSQVDAPFLGEGKFRHSFEAAIDAISPDPNQPRRSFDDAGLNDLAESLKAQGQLQPILLRQDPTHRDMWIVVAGERRWRAAKLAGWTSILAIPHEGNSASAALMENLMRVDLSPAEEARGIKNLLDHNNWSQRQAAKELGMDQARISRAIRVLSLPDEFLDLAGKAAVPMNVLVGIARVDDMAHREGLMRKALEGELTVASLNKNGAAAEPHMEKATGPRPVSRRKLNISKTAPKIIEMLSEAGNNNTEFSKAEIAALRSLYEALTKIVG
ncbi:ParB/RepB/Spo0J family partition protein [Gluconobacter cerinus]|uniref:ParB/RepB/Spo0J family partition protein n=1 Tax=Gluconobacter cerinus TaxID=38307 RepID=UPI00193F955E|nr:ParB/RepB/Spo0J family partition protein [Gluconobacter cerinus]MBM3099280.1 ParB/RepB/Spo0J family partition protein [Gluconobacter cerinus]